jgi:hypothetical protein
MLTLRVGRDRTKAKDNLSNLNKSYNMAIQERDIAVSNTNDLTAV